SFKAQRTLDSAKVSAASSRLKTAFTRNPRHTFALPLADLENRQTAEVEQARKRRDDRAVGIESIEAAVERLEWIVLPHFGRQARKVTRLYIGWVGDDDIEGALDPLGPVARGKCGARRETVTVGIGPRHLKRALRPVDAQPRRVRIFGEQRQQDRPGAGAQIEDMQRPGAVRDR